MHKMHEMLCVAPGSAAEREGRKTNGERRQEPQCKKPSQSPGSRSEYTNSEPVKARER